jgi:hypothetical protein
VIKKFLIHLLLVLLVFWLTYSFFAVGKSFNAFFVLLIYFLIFFDDFAAIFWMVGPAFCLELISPLPFGLYLINFFLIYILAQYLIKKFLMQQSLGSFLLLVMASQLSFYLLLWLEKIFFSFLNTEFYFTIWQGRLIWEAAINLLLGLVLFGGTKFFTNRLHLDILKR